MIIKRLISAFLVSTIILLNGFTSIYAGELSNQPLENEVVSPDKDSSKDSVDSDINEGQKEVANPVGESQAEENIYLDEGNEADKANESLNSDMPTSDLANGEDTANQ